MTYKTSLFPKGAQFLRHLPAVYSPCQAKIESIFLHFSQILSIFLFNVGAQRVKILASMLDPLLWLLSYRRQCRENHNYKSCLTKLSFIYTRLADAKKKMVIMDNLFFFWHCWPVLLKAYVDCENILSEYVFSSLKEIFIFKILIGKNSAVQ